MSQDEFVAVLTGDIIKSSRLPQKDWEAVHECLHDAVMNMKEWKDGMVWEELEFSRGDTWQLLLKEPALAMRAGVFLRSSLLAEGIADTRISIGLGEVAEMSGSGVSLSRGEAFVLSGHGLDNMTGYSSLTIEIAKRTGALAEWLPVVGQLCDALIGQWTERQAEIVCVAINPTKPTDAETDEVRAREPTHGRIAQILTPAISKQAVTKALNGANWHAIRAVIHRFEETTWESILK